jgi:hypothetical protein
MKGATTTLNPYLTFAGNCCEAMTFYKDALDGQIEVLPLRGFIIPSNSTGKNRCNNFH